MKAFLLPLFLAVIVAALSGPAQAYNRSKDPAGKVCLWWNTRSVTFVVNQTCTKDIVPVQNCLNAVVASERAWLQPCTDMALLDGGTTARTDVGYDDQHPNDNINLIIWDTNWQGENHESAAIALTTVTYDVNTGEIVDVDTELNNQNFTFTVPQSPQVNTDVQNTLVHEFGHSIGLDHSSDLDASMYAYAAAGETKKRDLTQDDINGECAIYPLNGPTVKCDGTDGGGGCGCSTQASPWALIPLAFVLAFMGWSRNGGRWPGPGGRF